MASHRRGVIFKTPSYQQFPNNSSFSSIRTGSENDQNYFDTNDDQGYLLFDMEDVSNLY